MGRDPAGPRATSNQTVLDGSDSTPQRLASSSTRKRPQPDGLDSPGGPGVGGSKPAPRSRISTLTTSSNTSASSQTLFSAGTGPCLTALVTTSLVSRASS